MAKKILERLAFSIVIFFALTFLVFALSNMVRGNAVDVLVSQNPDMSQEAYDNLLASYGLDQPIPVRYLNWLNGMAHGDMGRSITSNQPVTRILSERIGPTLILTVSALIISLLISIPLGAMSAYKPYSFWDTLSSFVSFLGSSVPGFILCLLGVYVFAVRLKLVPTQGMYDVGQPHTFGNLLKHLILPATVTGLQMTGSLLKQTRSAILEVMNEDYIKTARSKGLSELAVVIIHALRNALIPIITTVSLSIPFLVGGSVIVERIFSWPGMGNLLVTSITSRDYNPIMGATVVICLTVLISNIILDLLYMVVDPRISKGR